MLNWSFRVLESIIFNTKLVPQIWRNFFHSKGSQSTGTEAQRACAVFILGGFPNSTRSTLEQPGLTSELTMVWAEGCSRDLLMSLPTWIILWSYEKIMHYLTDTSDDWTQRWRGWSSGYFSNQCAWPYWPCTSWS